MVFEILAVGVKFSELIALKQAEAESAKIKQKYTQQEAALLKQKGRFRSEFSKIKVLQEHDVEGSDGSESHVAPDIQFKLQTLPIMDTSAFKEMNLAVKWPSSRQHASTYKVYGRSMTYAKLPANVQERWAAKANDYKKKHIVSFPPFTAFVEFIRDQATICKL
ncbi:hypothetical protein DPMN_188334 [Dreissena polymorpha]|uniref:Uncharacterized protein n=1 Tax=Dreissena polymorpha TaxID=45954 RepID=A0A9D4DRW5_DREPO|nr:hypothetical protein DPMN_188334 [Dreissena polymorpha]